MNKVTLFNLDTLLLHHDSNEAIIKNLLKMTATQINEVVKPSFDSKLVTVKEGGHYALLLGKLTFMPITSAQAQKHVRKIKNGYDNLLMCGEWNNIERFMNKNGFNGEYQLTKSRTMCRLVNVGDYASAIKKEFSL